MSNIKKINDEKIKDDLRNKYARNLNLNEKEKLIRGARLLFQEKHVNGIEGHISSRKSDNNFWVTPLGKPFNTLVIEDLVETDQNLEPVFQDKFPHFGAKFHMPIYKSRPDINCIIHTHSPYVSALLMTDERLVLSQVESFVLYNEISYQEEINPNPFSQEEYTSIVKNLKSHKILLMRHHGPIITGTTIEEAFYFAYYLEKAAYMQFLAKGFSKIKHPQSDVLESIHAYLNQDEIKKSSFYQLISNLN